MQTNTDKRLVWAVQLLLRGVLLCAVLQSFTVQAQCTLSCPSGLNLSIAGPAYGCESVLAPIDIGVIAPSCSGLIDLDLFTTANQLLPGDATLSGARTGLVSSSHIGMQLRARVTHRATGNNCDINLTIIDGLAPSFNVSDTTVSILQSIVPQGFGGFFLGPLIDDCTTTTSFYTDSVSQSACGGSAFAKTFRRWTVTDEYSNSSTASQVISQIAVQLDSISAPKDTSVSCAEGVPMGISMGVPTVRFGGEIYELPSLAGNQANLFWSYADESFSGGGGTAQLLRSFRFFDACSPAEVGLNPRTLVQRISVVDTVAPVINTLLDTIYFSTSSSDCQAVVSLPALAIDDDCTSVSTVTVQLNNQYISSNGGFFGQLPLGTFTAIYTATDSSSNASSHALVVIVRDQNPPVLITQSNLQVSLSTNGEALLYPASFDQGSYDDCSGILWGIRFLSDSFWSSNLNLTCSAIDQELEVEIRGCDQFGNCNTRVLQVNTFDFLPPAISAPPNLTMACSVSDTSFALFGNVIVSDNCNFIVEDSISVNRDQCGVGEIQRFWSTRDSSGNSSSASQVISFIPVNTFSESDIDWPRDTSLSICESTDPLQMVAGYGNPTWATVACSNVAVSYDDLQIDGPAGVCEVIFRTWTVIEQCSYDGLSTGIWQYEQHIQLVDLDAPTISSSVDTVIVQTTVDSCGGGVFPANVFMVQDCGVFQSEVRFYQDDQLVLRFPFLDSARYVLNGVDRAELISIDNCGNTDSVSVEVLMVDGSPPLAICADTVIHYLQADSILFDVSLIDLGSQDACGEQLFSIATDFIPSCTSLGWNRVELIAIDSAGLQDACFTEVQVVDTSEICPLKSIIVYGNIATVNNHVIPTRFDLVGMVGDTVGTFYSSIDGDFSFEVELLDSVMVVPSSTYAPRLFISTYDLYLIGQHILGITEFTDPLKRFAGDANQSRTVSAFDMTLFRRLFLGLSSTLPHGHSVRFIPVAADLSLPDVELTPGIQVFNAEQDSLQLSWHALKLGDVSGTRSINEEDIASRSEGRLALQWTELGDGLWGLDYVEGQELDLYGLGLWLNSSAVRVNKEFSAGLMTSETGRGTAVSWIARSIPLSLKQGARILTVQSEVRPEIDMVRSDAVAAAERLSTPREYTIYIESGEAVGKITESVRVYPNPAKAGTMLRVRAERTSISSLHLVDARGTVTELSVEVSLNAAGLLPTTLAPGIYALLGRYEDGRTFEQRILVSD